MKKFIITTTVIASLAGIAISSAEARPIKTERELIGYKVTTIEAPSKREVFSGIDTNRDGLIEWKEFQRAAMLNDEYNTFITIDKNGDGTLDVDEYSAFDKTKGQTITESDGENRIESDGTNNEVVSSANTAYVPVKSYNFNRNR